MSTPVSLEDLLAAFEWASAGESAGIDCRAYVSKATGTVHWSGDGIDDELPEDIEDGTIYVAVPVKSEFDLGRTLAMRYVEDHLPHQFEIVNQFFRKRGAYSRFKSLLEHTGQLEAWHAYERTATEEALVEWCEEHGLSCARNFNERGA